MENVAYGDDWVNGIKVIAKVGNEYYFGASFKEVIQQLKLEDWTSYIDLNGYKANITRRVETFNGEKLNYSNDEEFLKELERIGFITELEVR